MDLRNKFAYPTLAKPGFSGSHIGSSRAKVSFSAVALQTGNFINVIRGSVGAITGSVTGGMHGYIGPVVTIPSSGAYIMFSGAVPSATDSTTTIGVILDCFGNAGDHMTICVGSASSGPGAFLSYGLWRFNSWGNQSANGPNWYSANTPFFLGVSAAGSSNNINYVQTNLRTGAIKTATASGIGNQAHNGDVLLGIGNTLSSLNLNGSMAAAMYSNQYLSMGELMAWAADPWSYWYPSIYPIVVGQLGQTPIPPQRQNIVMRRMRR